MVYKTLTTLSQKELGHQLRLKIFARQRKMFSLIKLNGGNDVIEPNGAVIKQLCHLTQISVKDL